MSKQDHAQIYEMLSVLFLTVSKGEQVLQCIREVVTSHPLFSPMPLFRYLSKNQSTIQKEHLLSFLEENKEQATQEQIKMIIDFDSGKKIWNYSDFLEFIYPFNSAVLREISNMHLKRYTKLEKYGVHETIVAGFLMLMTEQISLIRKLQIQKGDSLLKISKERLRKVLLSIKKAGDRQPSHCENDDTRITSHELRNFMRAFVSVEDSHFLYLSRRLKIKKGSFPLQQLQKFIKPIKKTVKKSSPKKTAPTKQKSKPVPKAIQEGEKQFNSKDFRSELEDQLMNSLHLHDSRKKNGGLQAIDMNTPVLKMDNPKYRKQQIPHRREEEMLSFKNPASNDNYYLEKHKDQSNKRNTTPRDLLIKFIQVFLPSAKQLDELRLRLAQHRVDYLKLFKLIDRNQRGVVSSQDLCEYYYNAGGKLDYTPREFELLIERFAQSDEPWLSFSEFCEMVRAEDKEGASRGPPKLGEQDEQIVVQIIQLCLQCELSILKIRRDFRKHESKYLFNLINRQQNGFINYQELKKFLIQAGLNLSMHDLMAVLKRLDRSRNGVVVQNEFVNYFQPSEGY